MKRSLFLTLLAIQISCSNPIHEDKPIVNDDNPNKEMIWKDCLASAFTLTRDSLWPDKKGHSFFVLSPELFITPDNQSNIYVGAFVNPHLKRFPYIETEGSMDRDAIRLSFSIGNTEDYSYTRYPSKYQMDSIVDVFVKKNEIKSFSSIKYSNGTTYHSYKELFLQFSNLGIRLDSIVSGKKYEESTMAKKNGIAIFLERALFSLDMDIPGTEFDLATNDKSPIYIASVIYGDIKLMLVESDLSIDDLNGFINKIKNKEQLTAEEQHILNETNISIVVVNSKKVEKIHDKANPIYWFYHSTSLLNTSITPLYAVFSNSRTHNPSNISLRIDLP